MDMGVSTVTARSLYTPVGAATIYSEVFGSGEPVVLLHGLAGSTRWWTRNMQALARTHEVHSVDLVGSGRSKGTFVLRDAAAVLAEWMARRKLRPATMIGHSMGGYIAAHIAAAHPQLVDRLVLVDAAINLPGAPRPAAQDLSSLSYLPFGMLSLIMPEALRTGLPNLARVAYDMVKTDMTPVLDRIRARSLVVWGENDPCVPLSVGYELARRLPGNALAVIKGAGHVPMWEQPAAFNKLVCAFMSSADGAIRPGPGMGPRQQPYRAS